ncbi:hypothetical protein AB6D02_24925 [Vibrio splendidus]
MMKDYLSVDMRDECNNSSNDETPLPSLDLLVQVEEEFKFSKYVNVAYFDNSELEAIDHLFESCGHRMELKWLIRNIHNWDEHPKTEMGSLLRYADKKSRLGIFAIMEKYGEGRSLDLLLNQDFLYEQF